MKPYDPKPIAKEIYAELDLSVVVLVKAEELIDAGAEQNMLSGKSPTGIAAGSVFATTLLTNRNTR